MLMVVILVGVDSKIVGFLGFILLYLNVFIIVW